MMISVLVLIASVGADAEMESRSILEKVQKNYQDQKTIRALFTQTYHAALRKTSRTETGALWAERTGKVRWSYDEPSKHFIFDGKQAYFFEPENQQVTIFEDFGKTQLAQATQFLWGQGDLTTAFGLVPCEKECTDTEKNRRTLKLKLKKPHASVQYVLLTVDTKRLVVLKSVVVDALRNRTEYAFRGFSFGQPVDPETFEFTPPPGVHILKAGG